MAETDWGRACSTSGGCTMHNLHCTYPDCIWGQAEKKTRRPPDPAMAELVEGLEQVAAHLDQVAGQLDKAGWHASAASAREDAVEARALLAKLHALSSPSCRRRTMADEGLRKELDATQAARAALPAVSPGRMKQFSSEDMETLCAVFEMFTQTDPLDTDGKPLKEVFFRVVREGSWLPDAAQTIEDMVERLKLNSVAPVTQPGNPEAQESVSDEELAVAELREGLERLLHQLDTDDIGGLVELEMEHARTLLAKYAAKP